MPYLSSVNVEKLVSRTPAVNPKILNKIEVEALWSKGPAAAPKLFNNINVEVLYNPSKYRLTAVDVEVLYNYLEKPTIHSQLPQAFQNVVQERPYAPVLDIISHELATQVWNHAIVSHDDNTFPWSYTGTRQFTLAVVQALPINTISYESVNQLISLSAHGAVLGDFPIPAEMWSKVSVRQQVVLAVQSIDLPFIPTSGEFARQVYTQVVQAAPLPLWRSPAKSSQVTLKVVQALPTPRRPWSLTRVVQMRNLAVVGRGIEPFPRSAVDVPQVYHFAVVPSEMPEPVGVEHAKVVYSLVAQATEMPEPVGRIHAGQYRIEVVSGRIDALPISASRLGQMRVEAVVGADYPLPDAMIIKGQAKQVYTTSVIAADYPPAYVPSFTKVSQMLAKYTQVADISWYPSPEDVLDRSKVARLGQVFELVAQSLAKPLPQSRTRVPSFGQMITMALPMPSPEEMATSGVFISQTFGQLLQKAVYPDTGIPASAVISQQVVGQLLQVAEYPDAFIPTSTIDLTQLTQQVLLEEGYPDWTEMHQPIDVQQVTQQLSSVAEYPDAGTLHAPVVSFSVAQQVATVSQYPDKDIPQSTLSVRHIVVQVTGKATYPDKDIPQSDLRVLQVRQNVLARDLKMYEMPKLPRRHRVRIVCRFVY